MTARCAVESHSATMSTLLSAAQVESHDPRVIWLAFAI
jgi:hypothetical protein